MPHYDYVCEACGAEHEIFHSMDEKKRKCPDCGKMKLKKSWRQVASFHARFSPMHPRLGRGAGNTGIRKDKK